MQRRKCLNVQVRISVAGVFDVVRLVEIHDTEQRIGVASQCRSTGQQDEVQWSIFVLISELDGRFAYTAGSVVITSHVAVSSRTKQI